MVEVLQELKQIKTLLQLQKKVLTLTEFCAYTGLSKAYAYRLVASGKIKYYRPQGKQLYFDIEDVIDFLKQNGSQTKASLKSKTEKFILR